MGIVGAAGMGKSRLMYALLDTWDGAFRWCSLEEVRSTTDCVLQLGQMLGLTLAGTDADGQAAILDTLANMGPLLLGLDGLDSRPRLHHTFRSWMLHLPDIRWIWTSQQAIDCQMQIVVVQGFKVRQAVPFAERAAAAGAVGVDRTDPFDKIVSAVDGNPLVLSLIAPRLRSTSAETLWARLQKDTLHDALRTDRSRTVLANSLNATWTRLTEAQKNTLMVSAQFAQSGSISALQELLPEHDTERIKEELVDQSLMIPELHGSMVRYRLMRPLGWFVSTLPMDAILQQRLKQWMSRQITTTYETLWTQSCPFRPWNSYNHLNEETSHMVETWVKHWSMLGAEVQVHLALVTEFWVHAGPRARGLDLLTHPATRTIRCSSTRLMMHSVLYRTLQRFDESKQWLQRAKVCAERLNHGPLLARVLSLQSMLHIVYGELDSADETLQAAVRAVTPDAYEESNISGLFGFLRWQQRRLDDAKQLFRTSIDRRRMSAGGSQSVPPLLYVMMGIVMADLGEDPTDSIAKGIELATRATHRQSLINLFMTRAYWYTETGAYAAALEDLAVVDTSAETLRAGVFSRLKFQTAMTHFCDGQWDAVETTIQSWLEEGGGESKDRRSVFECSALMCITYRLKNNDARAKSFHTLATEQYQALRFPALKYVVRSVRLGCWGPEVTDAEAPKGIKGRLWLEHVA